MTTRQNHHRATRRSAHQQPPPSGEAAGGGVLYAATTTMVSHIPHHPLANLSKEKTDGRREHPRPCRQIHAQKKNRISRRPSSWNAQGR